MSNDVQMTLYVSIDLKKDIEQYCYDYNRKRDRGTKALNQSELLRAAIGEYLRNHATPAPVPTDEAEAVVEQMFN